MIQILGISHHTAPLEIREKYTFTQKEIVSFSNTVQLEGEIDEIVILSTCNRTEFYFSQNGWTAERAFQYLLNKLSAHKSYKDFNGEMFYKYTDEDAVRHLFKVSSGLDSMLFGEDQIIGQVKEAYIFSTEMGYTDAILMRLFQKSFEAGKRVRSETAIKIGTTSISHLAVEIVQRELNEDLSKSRVLVIGAGKAASIVISSLKKKKTREIIIANRTPEKAKSLLKDFTGEAIEMDKIADYLPTCNAVISASGAQKTLISSKQLESLPERTEMTLIDISVPLSIEKPLQSRTDLKVYQIDDLHEEANQNAENRKRSLTPAKKIIDQVVAEYLQWYSGRVLRPAIQAITNNLQKLSQAEVSEYQKCYSSEVADALEAYNSHITQKYIRVFIKNLKEIKETGHQNIYIELVDRLFKISS